MNPDNTSLTPPEAPPTGPVLSAPHMEDVIHELRAALTAARKRISELGDQKTRLQGLYAGALNRIQELGLELAKAEKLRAAFVVSINEQAEFSKRVIDTLRHERNALREGLEVYADPKNWDCPRCSKQDACNCFMGHWRGPVGKIHEDPEVARFEEHHGYTVAKEALAAAQALLSGKEFSNSEELLDRKDLGADVVLRPAEPQP